MHLCGRFLGPIASVQAQKTPLELPPHSPKWIRTDGAKRAPVHLPGRAPSAARRRVSGQLLGVPNSHCVPQSPGAPPRGASPESPATATTTVLWSSGQAAPTSGGDAESASCPQTLLVSLTHDDLLANCGAGDGDPQFSMPRGSLSSAASTPTRVASCDLATSATRVLTCDLPSPVPWAMNMDRVPEVGLCVEDIEHSQ